MAALRPYLQDILLIWTFFTRIPAPHFMTKRSLSGALWALPLAGLAIWGVQIFALTILAEFRLYGNEALIGGLVCLGLGLIVTGALHMDGLADLADGLGVAPQRRADVMRDSALGAFGMLALLMAVIAQTLLISALLHKGQAAIGLLFALLISRQSMALMWASLPSADDRSLAHNFGRPDWALNLFILGLMILIAGVTHALNPISILALILAAALWRSALKRWCGGVNGDGLGATQVVAETLILFLILIS